MNKEMKLHTNILHVVEIRMINWWGKYDCSPLLSLFLFDKIFRCNFLLLMRECIFLSICLLSTIGSKFCYWVSMVEESIFVCVFVMNAIYIDHYHCAIFWYEYYISGSSAFSVPVHRPLYFFPHQPHTTCGG